jgi:hypothetical protein
MAAATMTPPVTSRRVALDAELRQPAPRTRITRAKRRRDDGAAPAAEARAANPDGRNRVELEPGACVGIDDARRPAWTIAARSRERASQPERRDAHTRD